MDSAVSLEEQGSAPQLSTDAIEELVALREIYGHDSVLCQGFTAPGGACTGPPRPSQASADDAAKHNKTNHSVYTTRWLIRIPTDGIDITGDTKQCFCSSSFQPQNVVLCISIPPDYPTAPVTSVDFRACCPQDHALCSYDVLHRVYSVKSKRKVNAGTKAPMQARSQVLHAPDVQVQELLDTLLSITQEAAIDGTVCVFELVSTVTSFIEHVQDDSVGATTHNGCRTQSLNYHAGSDLPLDVEDTDSAMDQYSWTDCPVEILMGCIFSLLSFPKDLLKAASVCQRWRVIAEADIRWRKHLQTFLDGHVGYR